METPHVRPARSRSRSSRQRANPDARRHAPKGKRERTRDANPAREAWMRTYVAASMPQLGHACATVLCTLRAMHPEVGYPKPGERGNDIVSLMSDTSQALEHYSHWLTYRFRSPLPTRSSTFNWQNGPAFPASTASTRLWRQSADAGWPQNFQALSELGEQNYSGDG